MRTASIIALMMQHAPLKRRYTCTRLHGAICHLHTSRRDNLNGTGCVFFAEGTKVLGTPTIYVSIGLHGVKMGAGISSVVGAARFVVRLFI
jgi:hypothetical protein